MALSSKPAAAAVEWRDRQTDRRKDARALHRPCQLGAQPRFQSWGSNFSICGITAPFSKKIERYTQLGAVCYPYQSPQKAVGVRPNLGVGPPDPQWLRARGPCSAYYARSANTGVVGVIRHLPTCRNHYQPEHAHGDRHSIELHSLDLLSSLPFNVIATHRNACTLGDRQPIGDDFRSGRGQVRRPL